MVPDLSYDQNYFMSVEPMIDDNEYLREPQKIAYGKIFEHFVSQNNTSHAIVVLPTGVGKTGLMGIIPYGIAKGRVLIITPQIVIKDNVIGSLNPENPENFWLSQRIFSDFDNLPSVMEFEGRKTKDEYLESANIVIVNIQKLQARLASNLTKRVAPDYFDMIIIDEAHHSTASTWVECLQYFSHAKVVKLTGTPYRTDGEKIVGEIVYNYKLSAAMAHEYVKSLENFTYIPDELFLTLDNDDTKQYTVDQILELKLKDEDWISRTVAFSKDCSEKIVIESIKKLEAKLSDNNPVPHKIISVACSIAHAEQIKQLYEDHGYDCAIVHSDMDGKDIQSALLAIINNKVKVVINVAMLGEGYDHRYLSVAAIFRPFRSQLPYAQFIGRVLRAIPASEANRASDNIAEIVCHRDYYLDDLWDYYKKEIQDSETIKYLANLQLNEEPVSELDSISRSVDRSVGTAMEFGEGQIIRDAYLNTILIQQRKAEEEVDLQKLKEIQKILGISAKEAERIIQQTKGRTSPVKRPDLYIKRKQKGIDYRIREEIVPGILERFNLDIKDDNLKTCRIFRTSKYNWIIHNNNENGAFLAIYINSVLKDMIGAKRDDWEFSDWDTAEKKLDQIEEYLVKVIEDFTK